ncbi:MAG: hypothetical protein ACI4M5_01465 [Christensenellales bacterium]
MKTLALALCMAVAVSGNNVESLIESRVKSHESIDTAICLVVDDEALVCVTTKPIYSRTQRQKLVEELTDCIKIEFGKSATICFDCDIYYKASKLKKQQTVNPDEIRALIRSCKIRRGNEYNRDN